MEMHGNGGTVRMLKASTLSKLKTVAFDDAVGAAFKCNSNREGK